MASGACYACDPRDDDPRASCESSRSRSWPRTACSFPRVAARGTCASSLLAGRAFMVTACRCSGTYDAPPPERGASRWGCRAGRPWRERSSHGQHRRSDTCADPAARSSTCSSSPGQSSCCAAGSSMRTASTSGSPYGRPEIDGFGHHCGCVPSLFIPSRAHPFLLSEATFAVHDQGNDRAIERR